MRIAIAGAHGQIALRLSRLLSGAGHEVIGLIRNPAQAGEVREAGGEPRIIDLEASDAEDVSTAIAGADAVVFAAGAGPGSGAERKETVDYGAAAKLIDAARAVGANRYLMISAISADPSHEGEGVFDVYLRAKGRADEALRGSGLDYTIIRPGRLSDEPGRGRVALGRSVERGDVSRDDVAAVLFAVLEDERTHAATLELVAGQTPIAEALDAALGEQSD